jgi:hypothetical protein
MFWGKKNRSYLEYDNYLDETYAKNNDVFDTVFVEVMKM